MRSLVLIVLMSMTTGALGAEMARRPRVIPAVPPTEEVGCYWFRERQYCSRYCYLEVDGRRYCRERERLAYPQAPFVPYSWVPMKLGVGARIK